ncbi:MAG TPA: hypothetical protein VK502_01430 [Candidatus Saccharimonadales bacterium]|nr:hypothetical protein [Candidatus Saccharimonadales bacterium]
MPGTQPEQQKPQSSERPEPTSTSQGFVINKRRIRSLASNLPGSLHNKNLLLAVDFTANFDKAKLIGFGGSPSTGDTVLPKTTGPVGRFNAFGREVIQRNREKESFRRVYAWTHKEWAGRGETNTVTRLVAHTYWRFPRLLVEPPALELTVKEMAGKSLITIPKAAHYDAADEAELLHAINLFLELFGYVEIFDEEFNPVPDPRVVRRLNWVILPKGEKISEKTLSGILSKSKRIRPVELGRQEKIASYRPDERAVGVAGFDGYIIYVFPSKGLAILESLRYGNASYILNSSNWETLSKMTKQQLLSNNLVQAREIHSAGWDGRIDKLLRGKK